MWIFRKLFENIVTNIYYDHAYIIRIRVLCSGSYIKSSILMHIRFSIKTGSFNLQFIFYGLL